MARHGKTSGLVKGDIIKNRYEILRLIGEGGMSRVFLAADLQLNNKQWAIKEVDRRATDPAGRPIEQSLASEADLLSKLDHPSIVDIVDIEKTEDFIYVVMDHVEGQSLDKVVREQGPQSEEDVQRWMLQICDAVGYLHRQNPPVIYRDMKPNNIMLHPDGYVKLIDLGVAREYKDEARKDTIAFGTTGYAAPEQYGKAQTDARTDIYGIGATMWHLLGGEAPPMEFPLPNVREKNEHVGEGFADVIIPQCTQLERDARYQTCEELAADLEIYQELTQEYRTRQKNKVVVFAVLAVMAVVFLVLGFAMLGAREASLSQNYEAHFQNAEMQKRSDDEASIKAAEQEYIEAISYRPDAVDAYLGLVYCYEAKCSKERGYFTPEEKQQFDEVYRKNLSALQSSKRYSELSYQVGRMYWYYYTYGSNYNGDTALMDNRSTRIKASTEYFAAAKDDQDFENRLSAETYYSIATFTSDIENAITQGDESKELYRHYWDSLVALEQSTESTSGDSDIAEVVKLDTYELITNSIETYLSKFKDFAEVDRSEMDSLCNKVADRLSGTAWSKGDNETRAKDTYERLTRNVIAIRVPQVYESSMLVPGLE